MYILGIETSCDETSSAIVKDGRRILSCETASSLKFHAKYGGIVPEIASRMQLETISAVADASVRKAGISLKQINAVSVTDKPGLPGSLLTGICFAKGVSFALGIPLIGVNHLYSHIYAAFLNAKAVKLPFIALIVSGGHTSLFYVRDFDQIGPLGATCDDAAGEAFDKVAKILGLAYPGGPLIEKLARKGDPRKIKFSCSNTKEPLDFSFSGIKTAVLYYAQRHPPKLTAHLPGRQAGSSQLTADLAASFQEAVIDTLFKKSMLACKMKRINRLVVGGGVAANNRLREIFLQRALADGLRINFAPKELCMDNAAMVAGLGYRLLKKEGGGYNVD